MKGTPTAVSPPDRLWLEDGRYPLDWNGPTGRMFSRFRDHDLDRPIIEHLARAVGGYPGRVAVADTETSLTYAELWNQLSGLAEIITAGTKPGDLVAIVLPASSMFPVAMLACLAARRPFIALDPHHPGDWVSQALDDARPALVLRGEDLARVPRTASANWRAAASGVDEPACVLLTSGSTGRPKRIVNSQRNLLQRAAQSINAAHINAEDRFLTLASPSTIVGVRDIITALVAGASVRLLDAQRAGAREIVNVVRAEGVTVLFAFPALLRAVIPGGGQRAPDTLRLVRVGGDTTLWSDIDRLRDWLAPGAAIQSIYAATEAPMMQWFVDESFRTGDPRIPIGYPLPGNRLAVIDENGHPSPVGEVGELIVESPYVALGLDRFHTGDLVRQRPDGLLERIGRKDRQVKIRGTRVDLDGVEAALRRHPLVRDVGVVARAPMGAAGTGRELTLVAYVSVGDGAHPALLDDLADMMRSAPAAMRPARLCLVPEIPRLASSKLDVRALTALDERTVHDGLGVAADSTAAAGDVIARTVAHVWQHILDAPVRGADDDFFEAGGDSLKAITFTLELERALGFELSLTLINEAPTFAGFCGALRAHRPTGYVPLVPLKTGDGSPPLFFIHGLGGNVAGFFPMTRRIDYPGAVIGIQARGLSGSERPHRTVQAMAAEYVSEVKARQPSGPYYLCGYSFGGLVAFEMACRLRASGDEVALVGLFDTMMSPLRWPLGPWLTAVGRRVGKIAAAVIAAPVESVRGFSKSRPTSVLRVATAALIASARYRPGFYPGALTLFAPVEREAGLPSLESIWRAHASALSTVKTAGSHATMFSAANAESIAAAMTRCVAATRCVAGGPPVRLECRHVPEHQDAVQLRAPRH